MSHTNCSILQPNYSIPHRDCSAMNCSVTHELFNLTTKLFKSTQGLFSITNCSVTHELFNLTTKLFNSTQGLFSHELFNLTHELFNFTTKIFNCTQGLFNSTHGLFSITNCWISHTISSISQPNYSILHRDCHTRALHSHIPAFTLVPQKVMSTQGLWICELQRRKSSLTLVYIWVSHYHVEMSHCQLK